VAVVSDRTETVRASVDDVQFTLALSVVLVVAVIYLFLRSWRADHHSRRGSAAVAGGHLWPHVPVPLQPEQLVADGADDFHRPSVVDDAIVMIENISRYIEEGEPPFQAALKGAKADWVSPSCR